MGLFDFVKDAGDKLFSKEEEESEVVGASPERIDELRSQNIRKTINELGIDSEMIGISVNGEHVTLSGPIATQELCEKVTLAAGNQFGISQVDCQLDVASATPEATLYTVKPGDTLGKIAKQHLGDAGQYMAIFEANQPMLSDPNKIQVGQKLRIPVAIA